MKKLFFCSLVGLWIFLGIGGGPGMGAEVKEFKIPSLCDFSGPYADLMKSMVPLRGAMINWWNDTAGKKYGMKLTLKNFDTRYDPTVVASMWPGILAEMKPIAVFGLGGTDVAALQQRLPKDKVSVIYPTASYGFGWLPNQWIFQPRATYAHEYCGFLNWYIKEHPEKKPLRVAFMGNQASPALVDIVKGIDQYVTHILAPKGLAKVVAKEWIEVQPVDVSSQMKKIIDEKADLICGIANTTMAAAVIRAQQLHGVNIATIASPHHTIWPVAQAMKSYVPWEGHYVSAGHVSMTETNSQAYEYYKVLQKNYGIKFDWNPIVLMSLSQGLLVARGVEHAVAKVGVANLNGQTVYDALSSGTFTEEEMMGILPTLHFTKEAPFSTKDAKVKIETVKNGQYQMAAPGWVPVPSDLTKW